jgi:hypothetical protein
VAAGKALVVFGGGTSSLGLCSTANHLGLNNTGDVVKLADTKGGIVNQMQYGSEGGNGVSLVRTTDGDANAAFVPHPGTAYSVGAKQDGSKF